MTEVKQEDEIRILGYLMGGESAWVAPQYPGTLWQLSVKVPRTDHADEFGLIKAYLQEKLGLQFSDAESLDVAVKPGCFAGKPAVDERYATNGVMYYQFHFKGDDKAKIDRFVSARASELGGTLGACGDALGGGRGTHTERATGKPGSASQQGRQP